jgi:cyclopropane fatty-acyl-phospholipid synthase-like methyltransferase
MLSALGPHAKYSAYLRVYPTRKETIGEAEVLMMESYCEKAKVEDGQDVLDVGCGWGSLSLSLRRSIRIQRLPVYPIPPPRKYT